MSKVRRIDFSPDEYLTGVACLTMEERGAYWDVCALTYSRGEPVIDDDRENARIFRVHPRAWKRVKSALIAKGKLHVDGDRLINGRCMRELEKAHKRIGDARENGAKGGRPATTTAEETGDDRRVIAPITPESLPSRSPITAYKSPAVSSENNGLTKAPGSFSEKLTNNYQLTKKEGGASPHAAKRESKGKKSTEPYVIELQRIKLTQASYDALKADYPTIPDLDAELRVIDGALAAELEPGAKWFFRMKSLLGAKVRMIAEGPRSNGSGATVNGSSGHDPETRWQREDEQWRGRLQAFASGKRWMPDLWGPEPMAPGCTVPARILAEFPHLTAGGRA
jgi:uncharacterized protein YdaU (DUF1376 family)